MSQVSLHILESEFLYLTKCKAIDPHETLANYVFYLFINHISIFRTCLIVITNQKFFHRLKCSLKNMYVSLNKILCFSCFSFYESIAYLYFIIFYIFVNIQS